MVKNQFTKLCCIKGQEDEIGFYPSSPVAKQIEEYNKNKMKKATEE